VRRWKRILVSIGIIVTLTIAYLWFFGTQTFFALEAHNTARKLPFVRLTTVVLADESISQESGTKLSYFGYDFEVPWTDLDKTNSKSLEGIRQLFLFGQETSCPCGAHNLTSLWILFSSKQMRPTTIFESFMAMKR
jgi:hypothetical protein